MHQRWPKRVSNPYRRRFFRRCSGAAHQPSTAPPSRRLPDIEALLVRTPPVLSNYETKLPRPVCVQTTQPLIYRRSTVVTSAARGPPSLSPILESNNRTGIRHRSRYQMISLAGSPGTYSMIHSSNSTRRGHVYVAESTVQGGY